MNDLTFFCVFAVGVSSKDPLAISQNCDIMVTYFGELTCYKEENHVFIR